MKLVDILARELADWPEGYVAAVQQSITDDRISFVDCMDVEFSCGQWDYIDPCLRIHDQKDPHEFERASDWETSVVTRAEWQAAVDALNSGKVVEWPAEGDKVEIVEGPAVWGSGRNIIGSEAVIRSVFKNEIGQNLVALELSSGECQCLIFECIKPIRTQEQIAAEEREKAIEEMILLDEKGSLSRTHFCGLLYDASYRKQVTK